MAIDKAVDSTQLNADLTAVADAIRQRGGTTAQLSFPAGMAAAVMAIPAGSQVQTYTGSFTTDNRGNFTANCGFKPDVVFVPMWEDTVEGNLLYSFLTFAFYAVSTSQTEQIEADSVIIDDVLVKGMTAYATATGFAGKAIYLDYGYNYHPISRKTFTFTAVKWS